MSLVRPFAGVALCLLISGCGSTPATSPREPAFPVTGTVKVKGAPVFEARVMAVPAGAAPDSTRRFDALTDEKGEFRFGTNTDSDGLPPGKYDIRITWPDIIRRIEPDREADQLNGRYNSPKKAPFTFEVKETTNVIPPFELK